MPETATAREVFGDPRFLFFSDLLGGAVVDAAGRRLGRLVDLVAATGEPYPPVESLVVRGRGGRLLLPWGAVERLEPRRLVLRPGATGAPPPALHAPDRIPLAEEILDRQIVDVHDAKVVRVNDLHFLEAKGQLRVAHVDVGLRGLVRRLGWERPVDRVVRLVDRHARYLGADRFVSWKLVQPLDRAPGRVRLEVAQRVLATLHPADLAEIMEELDREARTRLFQRLDVETAAEALQEAPPELTAGLLGVVPPERAADILEEMAPDGAADALAGLPGETRAEVLAAMERPEARAVEQLLAYPGDSVGGLMTPDRIELRRGQTVAEAVAELRRRDQELPFIYELWVVDEGRRLEGVVTLRDLLLHDPGEPVGGFMRQPPATVRAEERLSDVAAAAAKYDLASVPVVDGEGVLHGMVTVDDILGAVVHGR